MQPCANAPEPLCLPPRAYISGPATRRLELSCDSLDEDEFRAATATSKTGPLSPGTCDSAQSQCLSAPPVALDTQLQGVGAGANAGSPSPAIRARRPSQQRLVRTTDPLEASGSVGPPLSPPMDSCVVGRGAMGSVTAHVDDDGTVRAVKRMRLSSDGRARCAAIEFSVFERAIAMADVNPSVWDHIVEVEEAHVVEGESIATVSMELMDFGTLIDAVRHCTGQISHEPFAASAGLSLVSLPLGGGLPSDPSSLSGTLRSVAIDSGSAAFGAAPSGVLLSSSLVVPTLASHTGVPPRLQTPKALVSAPSSVVTHAAVDGETAHPLHPPPPVALHVGTTTGACSAGSDGRTSARLDATLACIARQLLQGLETLHDTLHVLHRDIKPQNVLVNSAGAVKLCDFGVAAVLPVDGSVREAVDQCGSTAYMSPERLRGEAHGARSDVWSVGVVLLELALGRHPFIDLRSREDRFWQMAEATRAAVSYEECRLSVTAAVEKRLARLEASEGLARVARCCLIADPNQRSSVDALLADPWVAAASERLYL